MQSGAYSRGIDFRTWTRGELFIPWRKASGGVGPDGMRRSGTSGVGAGSPSMDSAQERTGRFGSPENGKTGDVLSVAG